MKSIKTLTLLTIFLFLIPLVEATCTDSDGGKNYNTKGCVTVCANNEMGSGCSSFCDQCEDDRKTLIEGFCEGTESKSEKYACPGRCSNGACIKTIGCSDLCRTLGISDNMIQVFVFVITIIILLAILIIFKFFLKR